MWEKENLFFLLYVPCTFFVSWKAAHSLVRNFPLPSLVKNSQYHHYSFSTCCCNEYFSILLIFFLFFSFVSAQHKKFELLLPPYETFLLESLFDTMFQNVGHLSIEIFLFKFTFCPLSTLILASLSSRHQ